MSQRITDRVIEEIRSRIDLVELIGGRVTLKRAGSSFKACCPFHHEKTPSFHVNPSRQTYHCFGCGAHGDVFKFLMAQDGLGFMDAVRVLAERAGVTLDVETDYAAEARNALYALHAELTSFYIRCLRQTAEAEPARQYLASRKMNDEIIERFGIGYAPKAPDALIRWGAKHQYTPEALVSAGLLAPSQTPERPDDYYDRFHGRLMFPIHDSQGRVVAFSGRILDPKSHPAKYVNSPETMIFQKSRVLYALDKARAVIVKNPRREALVCEGQIDVIRCHAAGFDTAVASQGTAFTKEHVEILKRYADSVLLVFDGDTAGRKAALRTGGLFLEAGLPVRVAALPPGEDPDSLIRDRGADAFREVLDSAVSIIAFQVGALRDEERDPNAVDAVSRVAKAVLDTLVVCPKAVLQDHLLQEAAHLLHLSPDAMTEDLDAARKRLAARPAVSMRSTLGAASDRVQSAAAPGSTPLGGNAHQTPRVLKTPDAQMALCELLIHHGEEKDVIEWIDRTLPGGVALIPQTQAILDAWRLARQGDAEAFAKLDQHADEGVRQLFAGLARRESKIHFAREYTPREAAEDIVARLWTEQLKFEHDRLAQNEMPESEHRRFEITCRLKALQKPQNRNALISAILAECARLNPSVLLEKTPSPAQPPAEETVKPSAEAPAAMPEEASDWLAETP